MRKIFSKFRKPSDAGVAFASGRPGSSQVQKMLSNIKAAAAAAATSDPESGGQPRDRTDSLALPTTTGKGGATTSGDHSDSESRASTAKSKLSKWTSALTAGEKEQTDAKDAGDESSGPGGGKSGGRRTELVCRKSEHIQVVKDIRPPTQGNKWPKLPVTARPETIDEGDTEGGGGAQLIAGTGSGGQGASGQARSSVTSLIGKGQVSAQDFQQLLSTLLEIKVDLKSEIHKLNQRINKIDVHVDCISQKMKQVSYVDQTSQSEQGIEGAIVESDAAVEAAAIATATASTIDLLKGKGKTSKERDRIGCKSKFSVPTSASSTKSKASPSTQAPSSKVVATVSSMPPVSVTSPAVTVQQRVRQQQTFVQQQSQQATISELDAGEMRARMERELEADTSVASAGTATGTDEDQDLTSKL